MGSGTSRVSVVGGARRDLPLLRLEEVLDVAVLGRVCAEREQLLLARREADAQRQRRGLLPQPLVAFRRRLPALLDDQLGLARVEIRERPHRCLRRSR